MDIVTVILTLIVGICNGIVVIIAMTPLWLLLGWLYGKFFPDRKWYKWPTIEEYWAQHPASKTKDGNKCYYCGSRNIWQSGYEGGADVKRTHQCRQCNKGLYRSGG